MPNGKPLRVYANVEKPQNDAFLVKLLPRKGSRLLSTYAKLIAYSHRLKWLSNGHSRLNKCAINFARLLIYRK